MARMRRYKRSHASVIPEITLTPLIDTCLTLLIIFMVTSPVINNAVKVDLPKGRAQEAQGIQEEFVVHIDKQKQIFLNGTPVQQEQLVGQLKKKLATKKIKPFL